MTGIFFFGVVFLWGFLALRLARWATRRIQHTVLRKLAIGTVFSVLMVSLVIDELIGGVQFRALCEQGAHLKIDAEKIKGKNVRLAIEPSWEHVQGTALPIAFSHYSYRDAATNEEYASYSIYRIKGGWFIRLLGISEGNAPLTIASTECSPDGHSKTIAAQYSFNLFD
jgi:hypothetical protein